jgi:ribosome-associated protein
MRHALVLAPGIFAPPGAVRMTAVRASGPGGQNVNKVSSKVEVRVLLGAIVGLRPSALERLRAACKSKIDEEGWLRIVRQDTRDQARNLELAYSALRALVAAALIAPKRRRATRPGTGAIERRLTDKRQASRKKLERRAPGRADD